MIKHTVLVYLIVALVIAILPGSHSGAVQAQRAVAATNMSGPDSHNVNQQSDTAQIRFFNAAGKSIERRIDPADMVYVRFDGEIIPFQAVVFRGLTGFFPFPSGEHTIQIILAADETQSPLTEPETMEFEAGRQYMIVITGHIEDDSVRLLQIDETDLVAGIDPTQQAYYIVIHNIQGAPSFDVYFDSELMVSEIPYGGYGAFYHPVREYAQVKVAASGEPDEVLLSASDYLRPETGLLALFYGSYPGTIATDYSFTLIPFFVGDITLEHHGTINVGDEIEVSLHERGYRARYDLVLNRDMVLDISLVQERSRGGDAFLWLYDEQGEFLYANDEISYFEDNNPNAGFSDLVLSAGSYTIEAGTWLDFYPGEFVLSVTEAAEE